MTNTDMVEIEDPHVLPAFEKSANQNFAEEAGSSSYEIESQGSSSFSIFETGYLAELAFD
jgi:hypothetical protein